MPQLVVAALRLGCLSGCRAGSSKDPFNGRTAVAGGIVLAGVALVPRDS
jgi:hypothetical protein